jgi:hypothetical protein
MVEKFKEFMQGDLDFSMIKKNLGIMKVSGIIQ